MKNAIHYVKINNIFEPNITNVDEKLMAKVQITKVVIREMSRRGF